MRGFAEQLEDSRCDPQHSFLEMVRGRVPGIIAGDEDQNDHVALRSEAIFKLLADGLPNDADAASQPTLSRFENSTSPQSLLRLEEWFIQRFVDSIAEPPREVTLDVGGGTGVYSLAFVAGLAWDCRAWRSERRFSALRARIDRRENPDS